MSNKIFSHEPNPQPFQSITTYDRVDVDNLAVNRMDYYRHWGIFGLKDEPSLQVWTRKKGNVTEYYIPAHKGEDGKEVPEKTFQEDEVFYTGPKNPRVGTKSLFNNVNAVAFQPEYAVHANAPLFDSQEMRKKLRELGDCSIKSLVDASEAGNMGRAVYDYNDFMFCKYLGQVSNNYLITLRRFPFPAGDNINMTLHGRDENEKITQKHLPDVGRLVTWMGTPGNEMENILKYSVLMPYDELQSSIEPVSGGGESGGIMGSILNMTSPDYAYGVYKGRNGSSTISHLKDLTQTKPFSLIYMDKLIGNQLSGPPHSEGSFGNYDKNKNYGPVDVIAKTSIRRGGDKGGLEFEQDINLTFDYELRSYDGINTRAAFLDLLGNILAVTYVNGRFWGGAYMGTGVSQNKLFSNLPIYNMDLPFTWDGMQDAALSSLKMIGQELNGGKPITGLKDIISAAMQLGKNLLSVVAGGLLNSLGRPQRQAVSSLLTSAPVGLWHLTIGNPKHPIMSMGNMILTKVEIQHYGRLGMDDFPVGLRVAIGLKHAMPRDIKNIEHMYMMGDSRIYQPMGEDVQIMYESSTDLDGGGSKRKRISSDTVGKNQTTQDKIDKYTYWENKITSAYEKVKKSNITTRLIAAFGMDDKKAITLTSTEAYLGSCKGKTKKS